MACTESHTLLVRFTYTTSSVLCIASTIFPKGFLDTWLKFHFALILIVIIKTAQNIAYIETLLPWNVQNCAFSWCFCSYKATCILTIFGLWSRQPSMKSVPGFVERQVFFVIEMCQIKPCVHLIQGLPLSESDQSINEPAFLRVHEDRHSSGPRLTACKNTNRPMPWLMLHWLLVIYQINFERQWWDRKIPL